jgi:hypothetical protein
MVPTAQLLWVLGPVADEYADVVEPGRGVNDVVIIGQVFSDGGFEGVEAGLVSILVDGACLALDKCGDQMAKVCWHVWPV